MVTSWRSSFLGARRVRSNCSPNWTPNLPDWAQRTVPCTGPTPMISMVRICPGVTATGALDLRAHHRDVAHLHLDPLVVDAGDRAAHQAMAGFANALVAVGFDGHRIGQLAGRLGVAGRPKM